MTHSKAVSPSHAVSPVTKTHLQHEVSITGGRFRNLEFLWRNLQTFVAKPSFLRLSKSSRNLETYAVLLEKLIVFPMRLVFFHVSRLILWRLWYQGVGPAGIRDILAAHCKSIEGSGGADVATAEMEGLTMCALKSLPDACFSWLCGGQGLKEGL